MSENQVSMEDATTYIETTGDLAGFLDTIREGFSNIDEICGEEDHIEKGGDEENESPD